MLFEDLISKIRWRLNQYCKNYVLKYEAYRKNEILNKWNSKFKNNEKIVHLLQDDIKIYLYKDSVLAKEIYDGFEHAELEFLKKVLKEGDIFLDVGANVGIFSLTASKCVGKDGKVISFEPTPSIYSRLVENIQLNNFSNISPRQLGVSEFSGELELQISENGFDAWNTFAHTVNEKFQQRLNVRVESLDRILESEEKSRIRLVKIDVEGWEKYVLKGGEKFFTIYSPIVMVEFTETNTYAAGYLVHELYDIMVNYGYQWFRLKNNQLIPEVKALHYPYDNLIAMKINNV